MEHYLEYFLTLSINITIIIIVIINDLICCSTIYDGTQSTFARSKLTIETLEQGMKYVQS